MINKKSILYILLTALGLILVYNYMIAPILMQYNSNIGMGMHWRMYSYSNYYVDNRYIAIILIFIAGLVLFGFIWPKASARRCDICGNVIENDRWKICPNCGTTVKKRKGDKR